MFQTSILYHFLSVSRNSFGYSFRIGLLMTKSLPFPSSEHHGFPLYSWRIFSLDIELWVDSSFLLVLWKYFITSFWSPCFLMRNPLSFKLFFSYRQRVISLLMLLKCFLCLLRSLGMDFLGFNLLGFTWLLQTVGLCLL